MTGRLHPHLLLTRTLTARLAANGFPVLGIPVRSDEGKRIRGAVRAPKGSVIYEADYSQIELRTAAELSRDPELVSAYVRGEDIHAKTAAYVFGAPADKKLQDPYKHRLPAKTGNFSMLMGTTPSGLTTSVHKDGNLDWSKDCPGCKNWRAAHVNCDSEKFMTEWFALYTGVRAFMDDRRAHALKTGQAYGMWGMTWALPGAFSPHEEVREATLRQSHALPVSEGAQRLIKLAMAKIAKEDLPWARKQNVRVYPLLQIHDSLLFQVEKTFVVEWHHRIKRTMEGIARWAVPIVAEGKAGPSWLETESL